MEKNAVLPGKPNPQPKPASECPCCTRRFEMFNKRLREAVELFDADLKADGATDAERKEFIRQANEDVEYLTAGPDGEPCG